MAESSKAKNLGDMVVVRLRTRHLLGGLAVFFLGLQVVTGILLLVYYRPTEGAAYASMGILLDEVRLGWLVRGIHWWSSQLLIATGLLHLVQVYFTRAYQPPRRAHWVTGILLFVVVLAFGFTGTLLPWDQYAYWEVDAALRSVGGVPLIGSTLLNVFWGGWELGEEVLMRFYAFHVGILPWLAAVCVAVHIVLVWRTGLRPAVALQTTTLREAAVGLAIVTLLATGVLVSLATLAAPPLEPPADPLSPLPAVQPRWYFLPARQLLRHLPGGAAAGVVALVFLLLLCVPFLDRAAVESGRGRTIRWLLGMAAVAAWVGLALRQLWS